MKDPSIGVYSLEMGSDAFEFRAAEFRGILYELAINLVFYKQVERATYILEESETELTGSGGEHFDSLSVSLYRHLKVNRCHGPEYQGFGGQPQSFHIHSIKDALVAVAFFLKGGDSVPHFILGRPDRDLLVVQDRGRQSQLNIDDPEVLAELTRQVGLLD